MGYINISIIAFLVVFVLVDPLPFQSYLIDGLILFTVANQSKAIINNLDKDW